MNAEGKRIWQHAAGIGVHNHAALSLGRNVILHGPGRFGRWPKCRQKLIDNGYTNTQIADLCRFCDEDTMKEGDLVILRHGWRAVYAVGIVGKYDWAEEFNDIKSHSEEGWDMGHARYVCWIWRASAVDSPKVFDNDPLARRGTTHRVHSPVVRSWVNELMSEAVTDTR